jgi:peptidoglycan hydrolase-like protein with peptidoglycan-binding domain
MRGWQPWECAGILGLEPEKDARSGRAASRAEAAYMRPAGAPDGSGTTEPRWPGKVFEPGDCDPTLKAWQLRMNAWGYDFDGTGCYGEETRRAALALQRRYKLADTGRLGPRTWRAAWDTPP